MRILHVTLGFYPAVGWGGPVKIVYQNGKELVRRGHEVTIYCTNLLNKKQKIQSGTFEREIDGMRVVYFNTWHIPWWPGTLGPFWLPDLPSYLRRDIKNFDVMHLNGYRSLMMLTAARYARKAGIPVITQPHGTLPIKISTIIVKQIYDIALGTMELRGISSLIVLQESEREQAIKRGVPEDVIEVIPNGIDLHVLDDLPKRGSFRERFNIRSNQLVILFLGRINKIKGTDMLIEAFAQLNIPNTRLVIAGSDDGQPGEVKALVSKFRLESMVIFTGLLVGQEVISAFLDSDLFVLPSRFDAFPTTIMEACMMSVPMVITDRCDIAHMVKDRVAEVVPFDAQAFASAMKLLLTDQERYERYKSNCKNIIEDVFSIQAVVNRLEVVYQRVVTRSVKKK